MIDRIKELDAKTKRLDELTSKMYGVIPHVVISAASAQVMAAVGTSFPYGERTWFIVAIACVAFYGAWFVGKGIRLLIESRKEAVK